MTHDPSLPAKGLAEVRITAASPEVARQVAQLLRAWFASTEQRSFPAGETGTGTRLHLTVDTTRTPQPAVGILPQAVGHRAMGARCIWPLPRT
ncbi:hypothetical protein [Streptomyces sp. B6B3]|uniref:hypothetical protein n=1 Tax=Streptomyces sp. B6B3 TaxID=3153570 RepID=UPI00325F764D